ncbi:hypothetical protein GCM10023333_08790 [Ferrimonas pelagia]|uniref:Uncharacterized protein n=1 Tax=Ferrimonas pelagia TaxID=1177826 RepID=A0ABP9EFF8_9GAMM
MFRVNLLSGMFLVLSVMSGQVLANHSCGGVVTRVDVDANGVVFASIASVGDSLRVCSLTEKLGMFNSTACNASFSLLLSAKVTSSKVKLWFNNDSEPDCYKGSWGDMTVHGLYHIRYE